MDDKRRASMKVPSNLTVRKQSRLLEITFDEERFSISFELLRVYSPSAAVRGHGAGQEILQTGMREVNIDGLQQVGNYAVQPSFSDGHNTGIYTWDYLYNLGKDQSRLWDDYLCRLEAAGYTRETGRDAPMTVAPAHDRQGGKP